MVMSVLASTDLVAMLPSRLVRGNPALQVVDAPLQVPGYEMAMFWASARTATRHTNGFASTWRRRCDVSGVAKGNRKRHHDHARKRKIEIHQLFILSLLK